MYWKIQSPHFVKKLGNQRAVRNIQLYTELLSIFLPNHPSNRSVPFVLPKILLRILAQDLLKLSFYQLPLRKYSRANSELFTGVFESFRA